MEKKLRLVLEKPGIFVSKIPHCLDDILARYQSGEWEVDIPLVISNHETQKDTVRKFGPNFYCFPKSSENKPEQEKHELKLLKEYGDRLVCVRYRYNQELHKRYKTVELIVEEIPWIPQAVVALNRRKNNMEALVSVKVGYNERSVRTIIKNAGGKWQPEHKVWILPYKKVIEMGLQKRIVK